jgi:hypothetical protein
MVPLQDINNFFKNLSGKIGWIAGNGYTCQFFPKLTGKFFYVTLLKPFF